MSDLDALVRGVLAAPDDDTPRLVLADWLDDAGQAERAGFIRVQCRLALVPFDGVSYNVGESPLTLDEFRELSDRERWICGENVNHGGPGIKPRFYEWAEQGGLDPRWVSAPGFEPSGYRGMQRGFFERLTLPAADWLAHADAILAAHPVRRVRLTTGLEWEWMRHGRPSPVPHNPDRGVMRLRMPWDKAKQVPVIAREPEAVRLKKVCESQWPGLTFELPPPSHLTPWQAAHAAIADLAPPDPADPMYQFGVRLGRAREQATIDAFLNMPPR